MIYSRQSTGFLASCRLNQIFRLATLQVPHFEVIYFVCQESHFAHFQKKNVEYVFRLPKSGAGSYKFLNDLPDGEFDLVVNPTVTRTQKKEDKVKGNVLITSSQKWDHESPFRLPMRVVRFKTPKDNYMTLVTSLSREEFPTEVIIEIYRLRWEIEKSFDTLKNSVGAINLHTKKDECIRQELYAALIMSNFSLHIIKQIEIKNKEKYRIYKRKYKAVVSEGIKLCREFFRQRTIEGVTLIKHIQSYVAAVHTEPFSERQTIRLKSAVPFTRRVPA